MPDVIFACSDINDPHRTHKKCLQIFQKAIDRIKFSDSIWFYSGIWKRYNLQEIDVVVIFDKKIMNKKIDAIKAHKSQKLALYPSKPFWEKVINYNKLLTGKVKYFMRKQIEIKSTSPIMVTWLKILTL